MQIEILNNERKEKILCMLKQHDGCTISDVSRLLGIHPSTASKYLAVMDAERSVICKQIGMAKVYKTTPVNDAKRPSTLASTHSKVVP